MKITLLCSAASVYMQKDIIPVITAVLCELIFISTAIYYSGKKKKKLQEKEKMKNQFEHELLQSRLETQEHSFNHISVELHDNIGQLLSTTKLLIGLAAMELQQPPDTLKTAEQTLAKAIVDLRSLSKSLNNEWLLHHFNFIERLQAEKERINTSKIIQAEVISDHENLPLESGEQVILYTTVHQVLLKIINQVPVSFINIQIRNMGDSFEIIIESDEYIGDEQVKQETAGQKNIIQRRVKLLNGSIDRTTNSANNSVIKIKIPVKEK